MANLHPRQLRERAVRAYEAGEGSYEDVALQFHVGTATLERWVKLHRQTGSVEPKPPGGGNFSPVDITVLQAEVSVKPDATTFELTAAYNRKVGRARRVHRSSIQRALQRAGYVFKKNGRVLRSETVLMCNDGAPRS
jgi:transposase